MVTLHVENKESTKYSIKKKMTCFHIAVQNCIGNRYAINELNKCIKENINIIDEKDEFGLTALHYSAKYNLHEHVDVLLNAGADPSIVNNDGQTALHLFMFHSALVYDESDSNENGPILFQSLPHNLGNLILEALLYDGKLSINHQDNEGNTALHYAYMYSCLLCVKFLIKAGADPRIKNLNGEKPLDFNRFS